MFVLIDEAKLFRRFPRVNYYWFNRSKNLRKGGIAPLNRFYHFLKEQGQNGSMAFNHGSVK
ncbi:hypothetical protein DC498_12785 [Terrimonas sp.]|nr:hypothetical protein DC498_12785 [Terrimonas sp.]